MSTMTIGEIRQERVDLERQIKADIERRINFFQLLTGTVVSSLAVVGRVSTEKHAVTKLSIANVKVGIDL